MATVYKRGDIWWVRFHMNGRHVRQSAKTKNKAEAQIFLRNLINEHAERDRNGRPRHTIIEAMDRFFEEASLKPGTIRSYNSNRRVCARHLGHIHVDAITRKALSDFVSLRKNLGVTDTTIRRDLAFLGSVYSMAVRWGWLDTNLVTAFDKRSLKECRPRTRFLTREEFARLHACASKDLQPVLVLAVETGLRKEELMSLTLSNIDFRRRELHLEHTKTNSPRRVPLSPTALATIREIISDPARPRSSYLICKRDGSRMLDKEKAYRTARERAGLTDVRFHDLRHTFASWWVQDGGDLYKLSRVLGHAKMQMSARYGHLRTVDLHEELDRITRLRSQRGKTAADQETTEPAYQQNAESPGMRPGLP